MSTISLSLSDDDLQRIADGVAARLELRPERKWLNVEAAADYTSLSKEAIRTAAKRGKLVGHKGASGRLSFRVEDLDRFMAHRPTEHHSGIWE